MDVLLTTAVKVSNVSRIKGQYSDFAEHKMGVLPQRMSKAVVSEMMKPTSINPVGRVS